MAKMSATQIQPTRAAWPINDAAHRLGVSRSAVYKMVRSGKLSLVKIAGRSVIPETEIARLTAVKPEASAA